MRLRDSPVPVGAGEGVQGGAGIVGGRGADPADDLRHLVVGVPDQFAQQVVPAGEVAVEGGAGQPHVLGDTGERDGLDAALGELLERGRLDLRTVLFAVARPGAPRLGSHVLLRCSRRLEASVSGHRQS
ncbi:hypothetical protein Srufu_001990 [Streptomyces libani subsp. rufus]|nr:hypothetical protein Srufu_001990 [Streptomyces libani subsp. rufus]